MVRVRVKIGLVPAIRVNVAIVVMSSDITKGVWQAVGGGQCLKTTLAS